MHIRVQEDRPSDGKYYSVQTANINTGHRIIVEGLGLEPLEEVVIKNESGEQLSIVLDHDGFAVVYSGDRTGKTFNKWANPALIFENGKLSVRTEAVIEVGEKEDPSVG